MLPCIGALYRLFSGNNDATNGNDGLVHRQDIVRGIIWDGNAGGNGQVACGSRAVVDRTRR